MVEGKLYNASLRGAWAETDRKKNYLFQTMFDYSFGKETRLFSLYDMLTNKFNKQRDRKKELKLQSENRALLLLCLDLLMIFVREAALYITLILFFLNGSVAIDEFIMYIGLAASFSVIAKGVISDLSSLVEIDTHLADYREFTQDTSAKTLGDELSKQDHYSIEFKNVDFAYPGQEAAVLHNVSFRIEDGSHTSLVGLNGAGKSTIIKLLCRLYEPDAGEILLNGVNINEYNKQSYYKHIAPVFQDSKLYAFSLMENIALDEEADENMLWETLRELGMADKVSNLQNALDTQVMKNLYDDGVEFSGGEKQRLCLARAMYKEGGIIVLDEPTSPLDALAEKKIYEGFGKIVKGKTTLFVSHRLSSNRLCDNIIFLENGRVTAQGNHEKLMLEFKPYSDMYNMQARYYVDDMGGI